MADTFNVTQVTNLSGLDDGDGVIDPGEVVTTTVTITNQSTTRRRSPPPACSSPKTCTA